MIFNIYFIFLITTVKQVTANSYSENVSDTKTGSFSPDANKEAQVNFINTNQDIHLKNFKDARIIKSNDSIFLLNGIELFALNAEHKSEGKRNPKNIGKLGGVNNQRVANIKASLWRDYVIFVVALDDYYNVYVVKNKDSNDTLLPIEKLPKQGLQSKIDFFHLNQELYCVIVNVMPNNYERSTIHTYKWRISHFTLLEEVSTEKVDDLFVYTTEAFAIIVTVNYFQSSVSQNTVLNVYTLASDEKLRQIQMSYMDSAKIFPVTFSDTFYFYSVSHAGILSSYLWNTEKFVKFVDHQDLKNVKMVAFGEKLIISQLNDQLVAFTNAKLLQPFEIPSNFTKDIVDVIVTKSMEHAYVAIFFKRLDELMVTFLEIEFDYKTGQYLGDARDTSEDCVMNIRDIQRNRVPFIDFIDNMIPLIYYKDLNEKVESKMHIKSLSVAKKVNIRRLNINANLKVSIKQLMDGIGAITSKFNKLQTDKVRSKRSTEESLTAVNVKRLNIPKELFEKILVKTNGSATYRGKLTTNTLKANSVKFGGLNPQVGTILPTEHKQVDGLRRIHNLEVKSINGINWNDFCNSLYMKDSPQPIEGNLIFSNPIHITHLDVNLINEYPVSTFFTLQTDQEISSDIVLTTFHSPSIETKLINGIDFQNNVARLNEDNFIETSVKILQAHIGNLTLANEDDREILRKHIVGTRVEDLSQVYNGKVVIKGSLKLSNVLLDNAGTSIFVNNELFGLNVAEIFWMKTVDQAIGNVRWNSVISTPQLFTASINNIPTENFIIVNVASKLPVNLYFESVYVRGNVYTDPQFETTLARINKECVRRGSSTTISGTKTFTGQLSINDFSGAFDDYPTTENFVVNSNAENKFHLACTKKFESVTINGDVVFGGQNLILAHLNGINLLEFFTNSIKINQPTRLASLTFENIKATNLTLNQVNNHPFIEIISGLENSVGREGNLNAVHINGNVNILENLLVNFINEINFDDYLGLIVTRRSRGQIGGVKRFLAGLKVVNLNVRQINSVDLGYWYENALHKHKEQIIGEKWALTTVSIGQMNANLINGLKTKELIDLSADLIEVRSDIRIQSLGVFRNINGGMSCDIKDMAFVLDNGLNKVNWNFVDVFGYVEWPIEEFSPINEIMQFAVTGKDQIITGDTIFANNTFIDNIQSTGIINNVDMRNIFSDCLVKTNKLQHIKGSKIFKQPITVANMAADRELRAPFINDVNVIQLNNSIFRIGEGNIVSGTKTFDKSLKIDHLFIDGLVNGVPINDIVFANSTTTIPSILFHKPISIEENLTIANDFNGVNFKYLTQNIIRKAGPPQDLTGMITFQNLIVKGDTKIPLINGIDINDIIFKTSESVQEVIEHKTIIGDVYLDGPAAITTISGLEVVDAYRNSIFLDQKMTIRRLEVINDVIVHKGVMVNSQINGISIMPLINWKPPTQTDLIPLWSSVGGLINDADLLMHQNYGKSFHILYLDYASNIKIKFETTNRPVSFIIDTVHSGESCGLDHKCTCPAQNDVSLSPFDQIFINRRAYFNRILKMVGLNCNITVKTNFINTCAPDIPINTFIEWSTLRGPGSLTMNEAIFGVKLYEIGDIMFMLINHVNGSISAMKYDVEANNWFTSESIPGNNHHMDVLEWKWFKVLIILSRPNQIKNHDVARLWFYNTDIGRQGFEMFQEIAGEYNLCSKIYMAYEDKFFLFLSKTGSQFIRIFVVHWGAQFQLFQTLALSSGIKTYASFAVDDSYCLAVVTTNGYLYLYKYNDIEGWLQILYGYFHEIESVMPFKHMNQIYLFVSMKNSATVISVNSQGLH